jgi:hypothetical protein
MPHLFSGLHQKRQSGTITGGTLTVGSSKSRGSASRMVSHCRSTGASTDCVATILNVVKPIPKIVENTQESVLIIPKNDLFNRQSFYQYFNRLDGKAYTGTENSPPFPYAQLPSRYIEALNSAANRWARFLKVSDNAITYMKQVEDPVKYANWDGIELKEFLQIFYTNEKKGTKDENNTYASAGSFRIPPTSVITGFYMEVVVDNEVELNRTDLSSVFTHELGHALGFSNIVITNEKGEEILPLSQIDRRIIPNPKVLHDGIIRPDRTISITWNHHVSAYYDYGGFGTPYDKNISKNDKGVSNTKLLVSGTRKMPAAKNFKDLNDIGHLSSEPLYTLNYYAPPTDPPDVRYHYLGFYNEVMVPSFSPDISRYYISKVSLGRLLDLRTDIGDQTFYTYDEINPGSSEVLWWRRSDDDQLVFSGLIFRDMEKEFKPDGYNQKSSFNNRVINCSCCSRVRDDI